MTTISVDALAQEIRRVDGRHDLGADALAEALMPFITAHLRELMDVPTVRYDASPAEHEGAIRDHLIRMGWTPPAETRMEVLAREQEQAWARMKSQAQGGGEVVAEVVGFDEYDAWGRRWHKVARIVATGQPLAVGTKLYAAPPSAPVGVEQVIATDEAGWALAKRAEVAGAERDSDDNGTWWTLRIEQFKALAQQPAAVDGAVEWTDEAAHAFRQTVDSVGAHWHSWPVRFRAGMAAALAAQHREPTT